MYEQMAEFFRTEEQLLKSPARIQRYQALLKFIQKYLPEQELLYRELLTYDLYARENMKSRPDFAIDLKTNDSTGKNYEAAIIDFYKQEAEERRYLANYTDYNWKQLSHMTHLEPFRFVQLTGESLRWVTEPQVQTVYVLFDYRGKRSITIAGQ